MKIRTSVATAVAMLVAAGRVREQWLGRAHAARRTQPRPRAPTVSRARGAGAAAPTNGYLAPNQPDVNRATTARFVIGILSPGDTHDNGYYQSFVDEANSLRQDSRAGRSPDRQGATASAAQSARNLCRRKPRHGRDRGEHVEGRDPRGVRSRVQGHGLVRRRR